MSNPLAGLTPEELAKIPAATPPPGVTPNLTNPDTQGPELIVVGSILVALMLLLGSLRYYTKFFIVRKTTWDDWTCAIAIFGTVLYFIVCCYAVTVGKIGTHLWNISVAHLMSERFLIPGFFVNFLSAIVWPFAKLSFFILYLQLFRPIVWLRYCIYFGAFVNVAFYFAIVVVTLYYTSPAPGQSWQEAFADPRYKKIFNAAIPIASGSLALDVYIFLLPIAGVWNLTLSLKRKFGVLAVFATGLVACIASSLSVYYKHILNQEQDDFTYAALPVTTMALVEMCVGISASCMPALANMARHGSGIAAYRSKISKLLASLRLSKSGSESLESLDLSGDTYGGKGSYEHMDSGADQHEMGHVKSIHTFIRSDKPDDVDQDGIHLKHGFSQEVVEKRNRATSLV